MKRFKELSVPFPALVAALFSVFTPPAIAQTNCAAPPAGLVSWWRAEGNALDQSGINHGTLLGNTTYGPGRVGQAFVFDGNGDGVSVGNPASLQLQNFTIEAWVKRHSNSAASGTPWGGLVFGCTWGGYGLGLTDNGQLYLTKVGYSGVISTLAITDTNDFHHVVVTKNGGTVVFYLDGVAETVSPYDPGFVFGGFTAIGARGDDLVGSFLGSIDEVSIYNRALAAGEVQAIYSAGSAGKCLPSEPGEILTNGSLELLPGDTFRTVLPGSSYAGWNSVGSGDVEFDASYFSPKAEGSGCVDLNGIAYQGAISQVLRTESGVLYQVRFAMSGNPGLLGQNKRGDKTMAVSWGGTELGSFVFKHLQTDTQTTLRWEYHEVLVYGSGQDELRFTSTTAAYNDAGPLIDDITVVAILDQVPSITSHPADQVVNVGGAATFSVSATGTQPLSYQWRFNGNSINGATSSSLVLTNVQLADAGTYSVVVFNVAGSVTSSNAILQVDPACAPAPAGLVSWWPGNGSATDIAGSNAGTFVGANYSTGEVGQAFNFDGAGNHVHVPASSSLDVGLGDGFTIEAWINPVDFSLGPIVEWALHGSYAVHFYANALSGGRLYANLATVNAGEYVLETPASVLTTNAYQHVALTYDKSSGVARLFRNGLVVRESNFGSLTLRTATDLYIGYRPSESPGGPVSFKGQIDEVSLYNRALSDVEIQAIYHAAAAGKCTAATPPMIVAHPADQVVVEGGTATFNVTATGTPPLNYQWRLNGTELNGATSSSLVLENVQSQDTGTYSVVVSNSIGTATSSNAVLAVNPLPPCITPPAGIVSWWKAEGNALDHAGTNHGILQGQTAYGPGRVGQGFTLDGSGDGVRVGNPAELRLQSFTIEGWIKRGSVLRASSSPGGGSIFAYGQGGYSLGMFDNGILFLSRVGVNHVASSVGIADTKFHHVAVTKVGTAVVFYIDGTPHAAPPYGASFTFSTLAAIGARGDNLGGSFLGTIDEVSVYNRALSAAEIQAIHSADGSGKCEVVPFITAQPADQVATVGSPATFTVGAAGTQPLSYQWQFNGTNLSGATASSLVLANVQLADAGNYSVVISNLAGTVTSSNATLTVNLPPATLTVASLSAAAGAHVALPIVLTANGNENALGFSLNFDSTRLTYTGVSLGSGAAGAALLVNTNQVDTGKLGIAMALATDTTFPAGANEVVLVGFTTAVLTAATSTTLGFGDVPINRQVSDAPGNPLAANYISGTISIGAVTYEGDIAPRPNGDQNVTITDWVLAGRYAARLDYPTNASEFQRADTAPRATLGDGAITVTDWVQTGRYAAALDPLTPVGGPEAEVAGGQANGGSVRKADGEEGPGRQIAVLNGLLLWQQTATISVSLKAQGDENALGFSLAFDPELVTYAGAAPGSDANGATLNVNATQAGAGRLGFVLGLGTGSSFAAGNREVVKLTFNAATAASTQALITLTDQPVPRQVSDPGAFALPADYVSGALTVNPLPVLNIARADENLRLSWPLWATNFVLQQAEGSWTSPTNWTQLEIGIGTTADENVVTMPLSDGVRFYRLYRP